ncbi:hypothetical protein Ahy_A06g026858 [Arachis hypogaea]|uniref:Protein FAR1-RELATED SEQUENCE n=1 Tax=Arachis hypogaea TaxID=3818 RepID=A0A445CM01_ARAHY|nr:hypothetical protein Ahy_A06g026858 [Arachis hypogaea]
MDDSTSDCQLNQDEVDFKFESNEVPELVPKVGITFKNLEDAAKFYKDYAKAAGFSTRVRSTNKKRNKIKNQLITCSRERKLKSKIFLTEKTNPTAGVNCPTRIDIHTLKDVGAWITSKVMLHHSQPWCPTQAEMLKQHRKLSMSVRRIIENNEKAGIRPSKTFQSFVVAAGGHRELNFIEKNVRNYITREVQNVSKQEDAKEFGKIFIENEREESEFLFRARTRGRSNRLSLLFGPMQGAELPLSILEMLFHLTPLTIQTGIIWNWNDFMLNFGLVDNKWLSDLYEDRHIWVPIYLDHHFWAKMKSTQRSESMHSFFNKFITRNSSLIQFVKQYDNCLGSREQAERESDAADFHTVIPCANKSSIEAQFQHVYTHQKFRKVQAQFRGKANCITRLTNSALGYSVYEVGEQVFSSIFNKFVVTYNSISAKVMVEMEELKAKRKGTCSLSHEDANLESVNELQSSPRIRTRGRPRNRLGSKLDKQIANASKKKKIKDLNELNLFDVALVVHPNSSQYQGRVMNYQFKKPAAVDSFLGV